VEEDTMRALVLMVCLGAVLPMAQAKDALPDPDDMQGKKELRMMLCPSAVRGSLTRVENHVDGVVLTITARDESDRTEIRQRARRQQEVAMQPERGAIEHTGLGTGSGRYGHCPGMLEATSIDVENVPEGVRMTVHAQFSKDVVRLQQSTRARARALRKTMAPIKDK
jgi:hypothetical protein